MMALRGIRSVVVLSLLVAGTARAEMNLQTNPITTPLGDQRGLMAQFNVAGIPSVDNKGSPNNVVMFFNVGAGGSFAGFGYDVTIQTVAPESWYSEIAVAITNTVNINSGLFIRPGYPNDYGGGPRHFSSIGIVSVQGIGLSPVVAGADGRIRLEFFELYDDVPNSADGLWIDGTISFYRFVPAPQTVTFLGLGGGMLSVRRRRGGVSQQGDADESRIRRIHTQHSACCGERTRRAGVFDHPCRTQLG